MNLQTAIYSKVLEPKYLKIYLFMEELHKTKVLHIRESYKKDIADVLSDIILIKEKYKIPYTEDLELLEKYKL